MEANRKSQFSFKETNSSYLNPREDKFQLVSCPVKGIYCNDVLSEINRLYTESEFARINKEYQRSIESLQKAYYKTLELNESPCTKCVALFHSKISETLETLHEELEEISSSIFHKKVYHNNFLIKLNLFKVEANRLLTTKKIG